MKTILTIADYYLPGYKGGGPVRTIVNTVDWLGDEFNFRILTRDRDFGDTSPYPNIHYDEWTQVGKAKVRYLSKEEQSVLSLGNILRNSHYDLLYVNSFFAALCVQTLWARRLRYIPHNIPVLINPRGEFNPGSITHKRLKKRSYLNLVKPLRIYRNVYWQAATQKEMSVIGQEFKEANSPHHAWVVGDLSAKITISPPTLATSKKNTPLKIIFLSRISRTKNLDFALRVLKNANHDILFDIYGPLEDPLYWQECQALISTLPRNVQASYKGALTPDQTIAAFAQYHLFLFPTRGESYGHVIWESLYAGCPVLLSDQTPWRNLEDKGIGWDIPLGDINQFTQIIDTVATMDENTHHQYAEAAQSYAKQIAHDDAVVEANRHMFNTILNTQG